LRYIDCLANTPVGANLAVLAVRVLLAVGENNLLTETVVVANFTVLAFLVGDALFSMTNLTCLLMTPRAW
jgi:hypothetical protein